MIEIAYDKIVHTSDHFDKIQKYTEQLIKQGDMYMDDTDGETVSNTKSSQSTPADISQVKEQRRAEIPSKNRDATIEQNLARFKELLAGSVEGRKWSGRAKIDYQHKNGSMRDPVVYRYVEAAHHITGYVYTACLVTNRDLTGILERNTRHTPLTIWLARSSITLTVLHMHSGRMSIMQDMNNISGFWKGSVSPRLRSLISGQLHSTQGHLLLKLDF